MKNNLLIRFKNDYKSTLKEIEDFVDLVLLRPISYFLVKISIPLRLSPNMLTTISLIFAILSAVFIGLGSYILGAVFLYLKTLFDCADGQLARYTKASSKYGQLYDEFVDMVGEIAIFIGIFYSHYKLNNDFSMFFYLLVSLIMMVIHVTIFQNFRAYYFKIYYNKTFEKKPESKISFLLVFAKIYETIKGKTYKLIYLPDINKLPKNKNKDDLSGLQLIFKKFFKFSIYMFSFIAGTSHQIVLMGLLIADRIDLIFPIFIIYYNIAFAIMLVIHYINVMVFKFKTK